MGKSSTTSQTRAARTKAKASEPPKPRAKEPAPQPLPAPVRTGDFPAALARIVTSVFQTSTPDGPVRPGWENLGPAVEDDVMQYVSRAIIAACKRGQLSVRVSYTAIADAIGKELCANPPAKTFVEHWLDKNGYSYLRYEEFINIIWSNAYILTKKDD